MKTLLTEYANYNYWANKKLCDLLITFDASVIQRDIPSSFRTIKDTVYHIWGAESLWRQRIEGNSSNIPPSRNFTGTFQEGIKLFNDESLKLIELVKNPNDDDLSRVIDYKNMAGQPFSNRLYEIIMHCMNHSTFHRGQIITMLRNAGATNLFSTDMINYFRTK